MDFSHILFFKLNYVYFSPFFLVILFQLFLYFLFQFAMSAWRIWFVNSRHCLSVESSKGYSRWSTICCVEKELQVVAKSYICTFFWFPFILHFLLPQFSFQLFEFLIKFSLFFYQIFFFRFGFHLNSTPISSLPIFIVLFSTSMYSFSSSINRLLHSFFLSV